MAVTVVAAQKLTKNTPLLAVTYTAPTTAADGFTVDLSTINDDKLVLQFLNSGAADRTFTVKKGNALQGYADVVSGNVAAGATGAITIESGRFVNTSGTNKNKILVIVAHAELKMGALVI